LTPGEVMQLPADEAVVMVGSCPPIRAKKLRYFADENFKRRVLPTPVLRIGRYADAPPARPDARGDLVLPAASASPINLDGATSEAMATDDDVPRRQAEVFEAGAENSNPLAPASDLALLDDDDFPRSLACQVDPAMPRTTRLAARNLNDGIER
jgi:type IV secretion system protein VirD4